jgi:hypothetical protein
MAIQPILIAISVRQGPFFQSERNDLQCISIRMSSGGRRISGWSAAPPLLIVCWKPRSTSHSAGSWSRVSRGTHGHEPAEWLRPPLLRVMQNVGHCILSPLKKGSVPDINISAFINMVAYMLRSLSLRKFSVSLTLSIISRSCGNSAPGFFISYY